MFYDNYVRLCNSVCKSPSAVAIEIGIAKPTVSRWKSGSKPNHATLLKIADYFGVSVSELEGGQGEAKKESPSQGGELMYPDWYRKLTLEEAEQVRKYAYFLISERRKDRP